MYSLVYDVVECFYDMQWCMIIFFRCMVCFSLSYMYSNIHFYPCLYSCRTQVTNEGLAFITLGTLGGMLYGWSKLPPSKQRVWCMVWGIVQYGWCMGIVYSIVWQGVQCMVYDVFLTIIRCVMMVYDMASHCMPVQGIEYVGNVYGVLYMLIHICAQPGLWGRLRFLIL